MLITVPKRKLRHAVDRVVMRRRIREAYRLNRLPIKNLLISQQKGGTLCFAFIYMADKTLPYKLIEDKMIRILSKFNQQPGLITPSQNNQE